MNRATIEYQMKDALPTRTIIRTMTHAGVAGVTAVAKSTIALGLVSVARKPESSLLCRPAGAASLWSSAAGPVHGSLMPR